MARCDRDLRYPANPIAAKPISSMAQSIKPQRWIGQTGAAALVSLLMSVGVAAAHGQFQVGWQQIAEPGVNTQSRNDCFCLVKFYSRGPASQQIEDYSSLVRLSFAECKPVGDAGNNRIENDAWWRQQIGLILCQIGLGKIDRNWSFFFDRFNPGKGSIAELADWRWFIFKSIAVRMGLGSIRQIENDKLGAGYYVNGGRVSRIPKMEFNLRFSDFILITQRLSDFEPIEFHPWPLSGSRRVIGFFEGFPLLFERHPLQEKNDSGDQPNKHEPLRPVSKRPSIFSYQGLIICFVGIALLLAAYSLTCIGVDNDRFWSGWRGSWMASWGILFVALVLIYCGTRNLISLLPATVLVVPTLSH
jgi:hypothetical protein